MLNEAKALPPGVVEFEDQGLVVGVLGLTNKDVRANNSTLCAWKEDAVVAVEECHKEGSSGLSRVPLDGEIKYTVHRYFSLLSLVPFSGDKVFASP